MTPATDLLNAFDRFGEIAAFLGIGALVIVGAVFVLAMLTSPRR